MTMRPWGSPRRTGVGKSELLLPDEKLGNLR
jgi:hypothetical protein